MCIRDRHTEADAEIRNILLARIACRKYHALNAAAAETARHQNAVGRAENAVDIVGGKRFGVDPIYLHFVAVAVPRMVQRLGDREIRCV